MQDQNRRLEEVARKGLPSRVPWAESGSPRVLG